MSDKLSAALDGIRARIAKVTDGLDFMPDGEPWPVEDGTRLLAAVDAVLTRHVPKTVTVTHLCGAHHRVVIPDCADCTTSEQTTCAGCDPVCPDDNNWPCADYLAISRELTGGAS